jgi:hypothetical protein
MISTRRSNWRRWRQDLQQAGFRPSDPDGTYRLDGITFDMKGDWPALRSRRVKPDPASSRPGKHAAGLWKVVSSGGSGHDFRLFEFPLSAIDAEDPASSDEPVSPFADTLAWALDTADGAPPAGWSPPARDVVEDWIPAGELTVGAGDFVRQGSLIHGPGCLALRFLVIPEVPAELSASRRSWLQALVTDAQDRWRMVRFDMSGGRVLAEVDLSGAPAAILQPIMRTSLDALRWVVAWVGPPAAFICDPAATSEILESLVPQ